MFGCLPKSIYWKRCQSCFSIWDKPAVVTTLPIWVEAVSPAYNAVCVACLIKNVVNKNINRTFTNLVFLFIQSIGSCHDGSLSSSHDLLPSDLGLSSKKPYMEKGGAASLKENVCQVRSHCSQNSKPMCFLTDLPLLSRVQGKPDEVTSVVR